MKNFTQNAIGVVCICCMVWSLVSWCQRLYNTPSARIISAGIVRASK